MRIIQISVLGRTPAAYDPYVDADRWLDATWPVVRGALAPPPGRVVELGCGPHGGHVPRLRADGYEAVGVDPRAPDAAEFRSMEFERFEPAVAVDALVASTSLHHVADPGEVVERMAAMLTPTGVIVVVEWDWEHFDEPTAAWAFERLGDGGERGWLHGHRERWQASGRQWDDYLRWWTREHGIHRAATLVELLDARFQRRAFARGPYLFTDLAGSAEADERAAIEAGRIRATRVDYVGGMRAVASR